MAHNTAPEPVLAYIGHLRKTYSDLKKVYMFGSFARGAEGRDSDIGLAMVFGAVEDVFDRQVQLMKIRRQYAHALNPMFSYPGAKRAIVIPEYDEIDVDIIKNNMRTTGMK